jgi:cation:H+ antiporter
MGLREHEVCVDPKVIRRDLLTFAATFGLALLASFLPAVSLGPITLKQLCGFLFIGLYARYVKRTLEQPGELSGDLDPLYLARNHDRPPMWRVVFQVVASLGGIMVGAHYFVHYMKDLAEMLGASPLLLSLLITPIATELPEKFNSVLWLKARKDTLALGNITGSLVFQSCIPMAVGLWMTPWNLSRLSLVAGGLGMAAAFWLIIAIRAKGVLDVPRLLACGGFYLAYLMVIPVLR